MFIIISYVILVSMITSQQVYSNWQRVKCQYFIKTYLWYVLKIYIGRCIFKNRFLNTNAFGDLFSKMPQDLACHRQTNITVSPYLLVVLFSETLNNNIRLES